MKIGADDQSYENEIKHCGRTQHIKIVETSKIQIVMKFTKLVLWGMFMLFSSSLFYVNLFY